MNIVLLIGRVGTAIDVKKVGTTDCATFRVIIDETFKGKDGNQKVFKQHITVKAWGNLSAIVSKLNEGDLVSINGSFKTDSYDKNGTKQYISYVNADKVTCLDKQNNGVYKKVEKEEECPF